MMFELDGGAGYYHQFSPFGAMKNTHKLEATFFLLLLKQLFFFFFVFVGGTRKKKSIARPLHRPSIFLFWQFYLIYSTRDIKGFFCFFEGEHLLGAS